MKGKEYHFYGHEEAGAVRAKNERYAGIETPLDLYDALCGIWCADTCTPRLRAGWTPGNRTLGQCSITSFLAQDIFGGEVRGMRTDDGIHCYNVVDGVTFDLTSEQYGEKAAGMSYGEDPVQDRECAYHFGKEEKRQRYMRLKEGLGRLCSGAKQ